MTRYYFEMKKRGVPLEERYGFHSGRLMSILNAEGVSNQAEEIRHAQEDLADLCFDADKNSGFFTEKIKEEIYRLLWRAAKKLKGTEAKKIAYANARYFRRIVNAAQRAVKSRLLLDELLPILSES